MKKIIILGAGHGGLIAGAKLSRHGYDVTVYEEKSRAELGHDWEDRFTFDVLLNAVEKDEVPSEYWRYRGDCRFVSPSKRTNVDINYSDANRQKVMWRKPLIGMIIDYCSASGVKFKYGVHVKNAIVENDSVIGVSTSDGDIYGDLVIDALGVFSEVRSSLPKSFNIEDLPDSGDVFYAYRAYFNKIGDPEPDYPFEVYLYHEREQGLSWFLTNEDNVDILIGRIYPLTDKKIEQQLALFRADHPWAGDTVLHGGVRGIIPVRRPLDLMVANGYALVGDSAFMTTPMNGMGIDLSINAGLLLAKTVIDAGNAPLDAKVLWNYNRDFHKNYGGTTAKNEGLKNSLLNLPADGVDFLFDNAIIESSDLAGAGQNTSLKALLGKFRRGMRNPPYFFAILKGLIKGARLSSLLKNAPKTYNPAKIRKWQSKIQRTRIKINQK